MDEKIKDSIAHLQSGYFKVTDNILIEKDEFYGIGSEFYPFKGCFDFNNNIVSLNVLNTNYADLFFNNQLDAGLFGYIDGSDLSCVIRNLSSRGSYSFNGANASNYTINAGGFAGKSIGNVIYRNISANTSINLNDNFSINVGGLFGYLNSPLDFNCNVVAEGTQTTINALSSGDNTSIYMGGLAGIANNIYINAYHDNTTAASYIANLNSRKAKVSSVGAVMGKYEITNSKQFCIRNMSIQSQNDIFVYSTNGNIDNSDAYASATGSVGTFNISNNGSLLVRPLQYSNDSEEADKANLKIEANMMSSSGTAHGNVYAAGLYGYMSESTANNIHFFNEQIEKGYTIFNADVDVKAIQNGKGHTYAGGIFAIHAFKLQSETLTDIELNLTSQDSTINVLANQTLMAKSESNNDIYECFAGYYSSTLQDRYDLHNFNFTINHGEVIARRDVGATIAGPIYVGGVCGEYTGSSSSTRFQNITINLNDSSLHALSLSYDARTIKSTNINLAIGGFVGHLQNCGKDESSTPGARNINVNVTNLISSEYAIRGIQNAYAGDDSKDHECEGYVGGIVGYLDHSFLNNVNFESVDKQVKIYLSATNNPNTSSIGGLVGDTNGNYNSSIINGSVKNLHVIGNAYVEKNSGATFDMYVGGAIGVLVSGQKGVTSNIQNVYVYDSKIEAIGDEEMITYAGGIAGGVWWAGGTTINNCYVIDSEIIATSVSNNARSGGIVGLAQNSTINQSYAINSKIRAASYNDSFDAQIGGIIGTIRGSVTIGNCISTSYLSSARNNSYFYSISANRFSSTEAGTLVETNNDKCYRCYYDPFKIQDHKSSMGENYGTAVYIYDTQQYLEIPSRSNGTYNIYTALSSQTSTFGISYDITPTEIIQLTNTNRISRKNNDISYNRTIYGSIVKNINGKNYNLFSYPIYVEPYDSTSTEFFPEYRIKNGDTDEVVTGAINQKQVVNDKNTVQDIKPEEANVVGLYHGTNNDNKKFTYIRVQVGNTYKATKIKLDFEGITAGGYDVNVPRINYYQLSDLDVNVVKENGEIVIVDEGRSNGIIVDSVTYSKPSTTQAKNTKDFSGTLFFDRQPSAITIWAKENLGERTNILIDCGTNGDVIIDFIPNYVIGLEVMPNENTLSLGTAKVNNQDAYIFAPGDTINMDVVEKHLYPYNLNIKNTEFGNFNRISSHSALNSSILKTNGTVIIPKDNVNGGQFSIECSYIGDMWATAKYDDIVASEYANQPKTITSYFNILDSLNLTTSLIGATFNGERKVVYNTDYIFKITPIASYGSQPKMLTIDNGINKYDLFTEQTTQELLDKKDYFIHNKEGIISIDGIDFHYQYDNQDGSFEFTIPAKMLNTNAKQLNINVEFYRVYNVVFDKGVGYGNFTNRYNVFEFVEDTSFLDIYNYIKDSSVYQLSLYGFDFKGYYLTDRASTLVSYGTSFIEMKDTDKVLSGPIQFYARWTYDVLIDAPEEIEVESTFPLGLLEGSDEQTKLIPINLSNSFTFRLNNIGNFKGTPQFQVFIIKETNSNGSVAYSFEDITSYCKYDEVAEGYKVDPNAINGIIYIKVFSDNIYINGGETNSSINADTNVLEDGIYTLQYNTNYGKNGRTFENTLSNGIKFDFSKDNQFNLPSGTSLRLYRLINDQPFDSGVCILNENQDIVDLSMFMNMDGSGALSTHRYEGLVYSESFYIVVTLPLYENYLSADVNQIDLKAVVIKPNGYKEPDFITYSYGNYSKEVENANARPNPEQLNNGKVEYSIYKGYQLIINRNDASNNYSLEIKKYQETSIKDYRHNQNNIVLCVMKQDGKENTLSLSYNKVYSTAVADYYLIENGLVTLNSNDLKGYTIMILEVEDLQNPASSVMLDKHVFM